MRILHCCLACFYIDNYNYQENILPRINKEDGHDVLIVASTQTFIDNKTLGYTEPKEYMTEFGVPIIRVPYHNIINQFVSSKIRSFIGVYDIINRFKPDVILYHGVGGWELLTVAKYVKNNPNVKLYLDSHEDFHNSGTKLISRVIQYKLFNRSIVKKVLPFTNKILFVAYESRNFLKKMYRIPDNIMEYYPLGGNIFEDYIRYARRKHMRDELQIGEDDILLVHSGKMDKLKRTDVLLKAFNQVPDRRLKLILIGSMDEDVKDNLETLMSLNDRIKFLGWKSVDELMSYLCACDLYVQPGGQSATMQNSLCCGTAVAIYPHESHKYLLHNNAFYIESVNDIIKLLQDILKDYSILENMKQEQYNIALEKLDYRILAERICS